MYEFSGSSRDLSWDYEIGNFGQLMGGLEKGAELSRGLNTTRMDHSINDSSSGTCNPALEFITIAGEPSRAANDDAIRKLVRVNASRSVQRRSGIPPAQTNLSVRTPESPPKSGVNSRHSGRTRFALWSRKPMKRVRRRTAAEQQSYEPRDYRPTRPDALQPSTARSPRRIGKSSMSLEPNKSCLEESRHAIPRNILSSELSSSNWVPIKTKPNVGIMLQYLFNQLVDIHHGSSVNAVHDFEVLTTRDQALFHAGLAIASIYYDTGTSDLYHCQQTLKFVSRRLNHCYMRSSDETIGAVGLLVIHDTLTGTNEHSTLHMNGLERMVEVRGGLEHLPIRLKRTLSMIDTFYAATWNCHPRFPFMHPQRNLASTLKAFSSPSNSDLQLLDLPMKNGLSLGINEILQVLRILTAVRFADPVLVFNRLALSDAIYLLEWQLLSPQKPHNTSLVWNFGNDAQEPFRLAAFLYMDMVLREMHSINIGGLVRRLIETLQTTLQDDSSLELAVAPHDDVLLWIFFVGEVASQDSEQRKYFVQGLGRVCRARHFQSRTEFEEALDKVGPGLQSFSARSAEFWAEMLLV